MQLHYYYRKVKSRVLNSHYYAFAVSLVIASIAPLIVSISTASATETFNTYSISSSYEYPGQMTTAGSSVFYLEGTSSSRTGYIGKRSMTGTVTDYNLASLGGATGFEAGYLTTGPDGNVWFDGCAGLFAYAGVLNASTGAVSMYRNEQLSGTGCADSSQLGPIATGSDGNVWYSVFSNGSSANRSYFFAVNPSTGTTATGTDGSTSGDVFSSMTTGSDGRLWVTDTASNQVDALTVSAGVVTAQSSYTVPTTNAGPNNIIAGPDGNLWLTEARKITKLTTSGVFTEYAMATGVYPGNLVTGPDGAVWFMDGASNPKIGRITTSGSVTEYAIPGSSLAPEGGMVLGPDSAIWYDYMSTASGLTYGLGRLGY